MVVGPKHDPMIFKIAGCDLNPTGAILIDLKSPDQVKVEVFRVGALLKL